MPIYCPLAEALGIAQPDKPIDFDKDTDYVEYISYVPSPFAGHLHTEETKEKIASYNRGKKYSPDTIEKMRQAKLGKKASEETRQKMSESRSGKKNGFYGKKHSQETIDRIKAKCKTLTPWNKGKKNGP